MDEEITPEFIQALADAGLLDYFLGQDKYSLERGAQQAATPMPQGQVYGPGYQAPHPLEFISTYMARKRGREEEMAAQKAMADRLRATSSALGQYARGSLEPPAIPRFLRRPPDWTPPKFGGED